MALKMEMERGRDCRRKRMNRQKWTVVDGSYTRIIKAGSTTPRPEATSGRHGDRGPTPLEFPSI